ncbi:MAG: cyanophycinase [Byssovorax sp.]
MLHRRAFAIVPSLLLALAAACGSQPASTTGSGGGTTTGATTGDTTTSTITGSGGTGGSVEEVPPKPADLVTYLTGNPEDAVVTPEGPGLILMGGGTDVDEAFQWQKPLVQGGDVVVLRTSGADGYNDYLFSQIGGVDSVETMLVTTPALADDPYVTFKIRHAEAVFLAGGDQATYLETWKDHGVESALMDAWARGAVIGGTSAGCAVLGESMFAAYNDTVYSDEALADPYNMYMTMERGFLSFAPLASSITDTHFAERDRMGRLVAFLGRILTDGWSSTGKARGLGIDEATALVVDATGHGKVLGQGAVYVIDAEKPPAVCEAGKPLVFSGLALRKLVAGDSIALPSGESDVPPMPLSASGGALTPASPY